jgi:Glycosyltransferase like family
MIAFGTAVSDWATYERIALPGIERVVEPDSSILTRFGHDSIQQPYNQMMDEVARRPGLEALVLLHQDLELTDDDLLSRIRRVLEDPRVGLLGALGARNSQLHRWFAPEEIFGFAIGADHMGPDEVRLSTGPHEVDGLDGALLILAPWVVRHLRFSERLANGFHGYDADISLRVRAHGGTVICEDIPCRHHSMPKGDYGAQRDAGVALAQMWDPRLRPRAWGPAFEA